jgi:hypothetical protein
MHRKVTKILSASIVFTFPLIVLLGINEYLCFMSSSDRRDDLASSKLSHWCSTSWYRSYSNTLLVLKYNLRKFFLAIGILGSCVPSTLCLNVMTMYMLINGFVYVCMLLNCCLCLITTTMFTREWSSETMIPGSF